MRLTVPAELIEAARTRQGDGMERLLETLWPHAYRIARSILQNDSLAEDAAQEACAVIYREVPRLRSADAFRVWVYRIVTREAVRAAKRAGQTLVSLDSGPSADIETRLDVVRAVGSLPPELRAVVVLQYYADLNSGEIGKVLGIPSGTVRFRLASARKRLAPLLSSLHAIPEVADARY